MTMRGPLVPNDTNQIDRRSYLKTGASSLVALTGLAGCIGDDSGSGSDGTESGDGGGTVGGSETQNTLSLQANSPAAEGSVHGDAAALIGDIVSSQTNGAVEVDALQNSELGTRGTSTVDSRCLHGGVRHVRDSVCVDCDC